MAVTSISLSYLIAQCPAPVSSSSTVTDGLYWVDLVNAWARITAEELPIKQNIINYCNLYAPEIIIKSDDYDSINNKLMHIKSALQACATATTPPTPSP